MSDKFAKWEKIRQKGKWNYIIKHGVLIWGIGSAIFAAFFSSIIGDKSFLKMLPINLITLPIGGIFWGYFMWFYMEKAYMKSKATSPEEK
ncbi:MAG: hypothetical protein WC770_01955 [Phycisphaerae bacterium]|jgi:hypothetical protein